MAIAPPLEMKKQESSADVRASQPTGKEESPYLWLLIPLLIQLALILYYYPPSEIFGNPPIMKRDYITHFATTAAVKWFIENTGRTWGYDPYFLAGWPNGTVFDVDNKGIELSTWLLSLILPLPLAFNIVVLAAAIGFPWLMFAAARVTGLPVRTAALAALLAVALWFFDPAVYGTWKVGMIAFSSASYLAVFVTCVFFRCFQIDDSDPPGPVRRRAILWLSLFVTGPATLLVHLLGPIIMAIPLGTHLVANWRGYGRRRLLALIAWGGLILAVNWYWLSTLIRFFHLKVDSGDFLLGGLDVLWSDLAGGGLWMWLTGNGPLLRLAVLALASAGLLAWRRERQIAALAIGAAIVGLLLTAYAGSYVPGASNLEPYRFLIPALFFAVLPASAALAKLLSAARRGLEPPFSTRTYAVFMVFPIAVWLIGANTWQYRFRLTSVTQSVTPDRLAGPSEGSRQLVAYLAEKTTDEGRILVADWVLGTLVSYSTGRQVIGGPYHPIFLLHGRTNADVAQAFGRPYPKYDLAQMRAYLSAYNIRWVVTDARLDGSVRFPFTFDEFSRQAPDLITQEARIGDFNVYRVAGEPSYFLEGCGRAMATYDRIVVEGACPGSVVLKFHWLETLRSEPALPLERADVLDDRAGFIRVHNGDVTSFIIYNRP